MNLPHTPPAQASAPLRVVPPTLPNGDGRGNEPDDLDRQARELHALAGQLRTGDPDHTGIAQLLALLAADRPLAEVLAACASLVPCGHGSAAVIAIIGNDPITGAAASGPAARLCQDNRWWADTVTDGRCRAHPTLDDLPAELADQARVEGMAAAWMLPLLDTANDTIIGCLAVWLRTPSQRTAATDHQLRPARDLAVHLIRDERRRHGLQQQAATDELTGLANYSALHRHLDLADGPVTLALLDLDKFKPVNDTHGHPTGDTVLQIVANRLRRAVRDTDLVARLGGDEFAIIFDDSPPSWQTAALVRRITQVIQAPISIGTIRLSVGVSIGIATAAAPHVIGDADADLYRHKNSKRTQPDAAPTRRPMPTDHARRHPDTGLTGSD